MPQKIILIVPDDMHEALQRIAQDEDKVIAAIVRRAISDHLAKEYNLQVEHIIQRGGNRRGDDDK